MNSNDAIDADLALTENVSTHGARLVTKRSARAGEIWQIAPLTGEEQTAGRVIYCQPLANHKFCVGLELQNGKQEWWNQRTTAPRAPEIPELRICG